MSEIKNDIAWRVYLLYFVICLFGVAIIGKAAYIQFFEGSEWEEKRQSLTLMEKSIDAVRGNIYAADGSLLATSIPIYEVRFDPNTESITNALFDQKIDSLAMLLSDLFKDRTKESYKQGLINARKEGKRYYLIKKDVRYTDLQTLKQFPIFRGGRYRGGLIIHQNSKRELPFKLLAARTIGYEGEDVSVGLEGAYSSVLSGINGQRLMQKIAGGIWMPVGDENEISPENGKDIHSTIDVNIQDVAESALMRQLELHKADHGTVVLMEVQTGAIRAMANLKRSVSGNYYEGYNYAIGESTEPGSTFKLPVLISALEDGFVDMDDIIDCGTGAKQYYDQLMYDTEKGGLGKITVQRVLEVSSNIGMAEIITKAYGQNPQRFIDNLDAMNLRAPLGVEISGEGKPYIKNTNSDGWSGISLAWMSHGYEVQQTPLQILAFYNAVANDGVMVKPKFVEKITQGGKIVQEVQTEILNPKICSQETIDKVKTALEGVVENGTARNLRNADYKIAGKTGTAQIANKNYGYSYNSKVSHQASFVGYFPADNPQYSCIVVVNAPSADVYYGNLVAGPIFKEVADKVYANSLNMHKEFESTPYYAQSAIPYSKHGKSSTAQQVFSLLDININVIDRDAEWITTHTKDSVVDLKPLAITENLVPNVVGMGLRDAIYLLENNGLFVKIKGRGMVKYQSLAPGTRINKGQKIEIELS